MTSDFLMLIGEKIREARKARKMSQKDLAFLVKCSPQLISKIEKGQVDTTITMLLSIQEAVGIRNSLKVENFYEDLEEWAKETGRTENTQWLKNQIESFFPMFTEWKKRRAEGDVIEDGTPSSKVA
jgi:transcriptional regulator with XRE-family HTH domain